MGDIIISSDVEKIINDNGLTLFLTLLEKPSSPLQIAEKLNMPLAKVNYLINKLVDEKILYVKTERLIGNTVEKIYAAQTDSFHLSIGKINESKEKIETILYILDTMKGQLLKGIESNQSSHLGMVHVKVTYDKLQKYKQKVKQLQDEFDNEIKDNDGNGEWYTMVLSLFPGP